MRRQRRIGRMAAAAVLASAATSWAAEPTMAELAAEVKSLRAEVAQLRAERKTDTGGGELRSQIRELLLEELRIERKGIASDLLAGYDKGFYIRQEGQPWEIKFNGLMQFWISFIQNDHNNPADSDQDTFRLRRAELKFSGKVLERMGWAVMIDPARGIGKDESTPQTKRILQDFLLYYQVLSDPEGLVPTLRVQVGQFKIPGSTEGLRSSAELLLPERAIVSSAFGDFREAGIQASGTWLDKIVEFQVGVFNGVGQNRSRDENDEKHLIERVAVHPLARCKQTLIKDLWIAASRSDGIEGPQRGRQFNAGFTGVSAGIEIERLFVEGEVFWGNPAGRTTLSDEARGWYALAAYQITDQIQPVVRVEQFDVNTILGADHTTQATAGLNYYIKGSNAKVQGAYVWVVQNGPGHDRHDNQFLISWQVAW